jgi:methyl-accepting chemotaxis protein
MAKSLSIRTLVLSTLSVVFMLVLLFTLIYNASSQREHMEASAREQSVSIAKSYFDSLNTMMLTGTMSTREVLREKVTQDPNIEDIRVVRGKAISDVFGVGSSSEKPQDEYDRRALKGEAIEVIREGENGRILTRLVPLKAVTDYQGVNCTTCHQAAEGTVLGAIRMDYSLASKDQALHNSLMANGIAQAVLFVLAFIVTGFVLNHFIIQRLQRLHDSMNEIAENADLSIRLADLRKDEIGSVSAAFNHMIGRINDSLCLVADNAEQVNHSAQSIASMAENTEREVLAQKHNTDQVATAMTEMAASAEQVRGNAEVTAEQSRAAASAASNGERQAQQAVSAIESLSREVQQGARRIQQLSEHTNDVATVLEVISSIAEQTNLLALNAAIEAARAGEQGRGFAVVADEVRSLASRTQESTEQIRQTIQGLRSEASNCVEIMGSASGMAQQQVASIQSVAGELQQIAEAVRNIRDLNVQMETAASEQSQVAESINCNVVDISESAQLTSNEAQQTAQVTESLLQMAGQLQSTVDQFKLLR